MAYSGSTIRIYKSSTENHKYPDVLVKFRPMTPMLALNCFSIKASLTFCDYADMPQ